MPVSFLSPSRTVLLVSDEFLSVMSVGGSGVKVNEIIPWSAENFEKHVAGVIAKDCGKKPVLILNDMVEQHYRKERVVKTGVSMVDKSSMVKRKLNVAFPNYSIRAAYPLKEKIPKTDSQPAADIYIFAAVANSDQITKSINATRKSLASVAGLCLLPVESSDMVKALSAKLGSKKLKKTANNWSIFIGQHRNGSLRQVLVKNGELALTRMSPIIDSDADPETWARELYQEFKSTMSYLARFGYDENDGLDVFVVSNLAAGEALQNMVQEDCNLHVMPVGEMAKVLGVNIGRQDDQRFADVLHAAWVGRKSRFILPMKTSQVDEVSKPRQVAMLAALGLFAGAAFLGYQAFSQFSKLSEINGNIEQMQRQKTQLDVQYQREVQRLEGVGFDAKLVQSSLSVYENFEDNRIKVLELFKGVGNALGKDLRIDSIEVVKPKQTIVENAWNTVQNKKPDSLFEARLKMTYPSTADVDSGNQEVADLRNRLESMLPDHEVEVTKFLKDYEYTEGLVVETGDLETENIQQDFVAEILVKGLVKNETQDGAQVAQ